MTKLNTLQLGDKIYDSFPDKEARQAIENLGAGSAAIIDVLELPTEDIDASTFYRLTTANFVAGREIQDGDTLIHYVDSLPKTGLPVANEENTQLNWYYNMSDGIVSGYIDEVISENASNAGFELAVGWYPVDKLYEMTGMFCNLAIIQVNELPSQGLPATDVSSGDPNGLCLYYNNTDNIVYAYLTDTLSNVASSILGSTVLSGWYPFENFAGLLGMNYGGVVTSMDDASEEDVMYVLMAQTIYLYNNRWEQIAEKQEIVQPDWHQTDDTQPDYIWNKPVDTNGKIDSSYLYQPDWNIVDESNPAAIKNRPFGDIPDGTVVYDGLVRCSYQEYGGYMQVTEGTYLSGKATIIDGIQYNVFFNGERYPTTVAENGRITIDSGIYFTSSMLQNTLVGLSGDYPLLISVAGDSIQPIDPKYFPSSLVLPEPNDGGIDGRALVNQNGAWVLSDAPVATMSELSGVSDGASAAHDRIDTLETNVADAVTAASYASSAAVSLGQTVEQTIKPKLTSLETQIGSIETALDDILEIQQSLIDSALPQAEGVEF